MLSSDDYFDFECAVDDILDECLTETDKTTFRRSAEDPEGFFGPLAENTPSFTKEKAKNVCKMFKKRFEEYAEIRRLMESEGIAEPDAVSLYYRRTTRKFHLFPDEQQNQDYYEHDIRSNTKMFGVTLNTMRDVVRDESLRLTAKASGKEQAAHARYGYTYMTDEFIYIFSSRALTYKDELIKICGNLPVHPPLRSASCGAIAYADLLPDDMTTQRELLDACELADAFIALLELNGIGVCENIFKNKHGFQVFSVDKSYQDRIKQNRSAFVQDE